MTRRRKREMPLLALMGLTLLGASCAPLTTKSSSQAGTSSSEATGISEGFRDMYVYANDERLQIDLVDNEATRQLVAKLKEGDLSVALQRNGGFEQFGNLGMTLAAQDERLTAANGDVFLYDSRYICFFYSSNTWSYTRLGHIASLSKDEITSLLSGGDLTIRISLT